MRADDLEKSKDSLAYWGVPNADRALKRLVGATVHQAIENPHFKA